MMPGDYVDLHPVRVRVRDLIRAVWEGVQRSDVDAREFAARDVELLRQAADMLASRLGEVQQLPPG